MAKIFFTKIFLAVFFLCVCPLLYCQARPAVDTVLVKTVQGGVKEVDSAKRTLILETKIEDLTISVPTKAKIFRGADEVNFSDIEKGDEAIIKYYEDVAGVMQVLSIILTG